MRILRVLLALTLVVAGVVSTIGSGAGGNSVDEIVEEMGGPGSFAGLPDTSPPDIAWVDITVANAQDVSATVVGAADRFSDVAAVIGAQIFPSPPSAPDLLSSNSKFELFATVAATGEPVTETCAVSGSVIVSGHPDNDSVSLSPADYFTLVFDACDDGNGYTLDGSFSLYVGELVGDPRSDLFRLRYALRDMTLTIASDADNYTASNGIWLSFDSLSFPVIVLTSDDPDSLQLSYQADVYSWHWWYLGSQSLVINADTAISATLSEAKKTVVESAFLSGSISYETIVPLQSPDGQNLESGEILVDGDEGNGTIRIVIESSASVRLDIDSDGDGIVDDIQYTTWAALLG